MKNFNTRWHDIDSRVFGCMLDVVFDVHCFVDDAVYFGVDWSLPNLEIEGEIKARALNNRSLRR